MAAYSGTPLVRKLGIKEHFTMYIHNSPTNYMQLLRPLPENVVISEQLSDELDMIHFFIKSRCELSADIEKFLQKIKQNGMIWVFWPKKSSHVITDVTESAIREVILPLGLVDIKVCAVDEVWSGLKLVIRKEKRT